MSFDEQPDPLSDAMEFIERQKREIAALRQQVEQLESAALKLLAKQFCVDGCRVELNLPEYCVHVEARRRLRARAAAKENA